MSFLKRLLGLRDPRRAANLVADGVVCARAGDTAGALRAYRDAVSADDQYALGHLNVALALQDQFNQQRQNLDPDSSTHQLEEMDAALARAATLDPELAPAWRARGFVARALGAHGAAKEYLQRYLELTGDEKDPHRDRVTQALHEIIPLALVEENMAAALAVVESVTEATPEQCEEAEQRLLQVVTQRPQHAQAFWALAVLKRQAKDLPAACAHLEAALAAQPDMVAAHKELASLHFHGQDFAAALPHALAAYQADPTHAPLVCNVGVCHLALGQLAEAREFITMARTISPKDPIVQDAWRALEEAQRSARSGE